MKDRTRWYSVKNALPADDGPAEILIYDEINPIFGVSAADFVKDLAAITAPEVTVRINSPGGSVFDGIAILNALRGHDARITTVVDGVAASIASVIAMGGDEIVMMPNSSVMVHNAWDICVGNADDLQKAADNLRQFSANIASIYAERAGGTVAQWQKVMDAETWYTADEAVAAGLADRVVDSRGGLAAAAMANGPKAFDLSKFKYAGRQAAPAPRIAPRAQTPPPVEAESNHRKGPVMATVNEAERAIDEAVASGRISASNRQLWRDMFKMDAPATHSLLGSLAAMPWLAGTDSAARPADTSIDAEMASVYAKVTGIPFDKARGPQRSPAANTAPPAQAQQADDALYNEVAWKGGGALRAGLEPPAGNLVYFEDPNAPKVVMNSDGTGQWVDPGQEHRERSMREQSLRDKALREQQAEREAVARASYNKQLDRKGLL